MNDNIKRLFERNLPVRKDEEMGPCILRETDSLFASHTTVRDETATSMNKLPEEDSIVNWKEGSN
jgi:hypothetical protein